MDWSDDVAYSVHDVEDGILSGRIDFGVLWDLVELAALAEKGARVFGGTPEELLEAADRLRAMTLISRAADFRGSMQDLAARSGTVLAESNGADPVLSTLPPFSGYIARC